MASGRGAADKDRTRVTNSKPGDVNRRFRYRPNPARQAIFVVLALIGIGAGYGIGYLNDGQSSPPPQPQRVAAAVDAARPAPPKVAAPPATAPVARVAPMAARPLLPENAKAAQGSPVRAYEEALPKTIVEAHAPVATPEASTPATATPAAAPPPAAEPKAPPAEPTAPQAKPTAPQAEPQAPQAEPMAPPAEPMAPQAKPTAPPPQPLAALPKQPDKAQPAPPPAAAVGDLPTWKRFAVAVAAADGRPRIAIVIDDLGVDKPRTARTIRLRPPLTLSFLTYASGLKELTAAARAAGHELMMHIPMEPGSADVDPGPNVLLTGIPRDELMSSLRWNLDQFDGFVGVNNHMGSRFTADLPGMLVVMEELKKRDLLFLDSITAGNSVAAKAAHRIGVPFARRNVFLDHDDNVTSIKKQLAEVESLARRTGHAVAIGHPREATLQALIPWLDAVESRGFQLVPVTALIPPPAPRG